MNKIWKGKSKKSVTQNVNVEAQCTMPIETGKSKRTKIILPLIVLLALICVIVCVWVQFGRPSEITEIGGDKNAQTEQILAATDVAATTIGTKVKATFTASTGEVVIYGTDASTQGTIKNSGESSLNTFWGKCGVENIKIITFRDRVYAPEDSSYLFAYRYIIDNSSFTLTTNSLTNLVTINNAGNLDTMKVNDMSGMFYGCRSLKMVNVSNWRTGAVKNMSYMFAECYELYCLDLSSWRFENVSNYDGMFFECHYLMSVGDVEFVMRNECSVVNMFEGCEVIGSLSFKAVNAEMNDNSNNYWGKLFGKDCGVARVKDLY